MGRRPGAPRVAAGAGQGRCDAVPPGKPRADVAPDLFTAETPLGTYQGMTDQAVMSRTPGSFRTVLVPRGSSKPDAF